MAENEVEQELESTKLNELEWAEKVSQNPEDYTEEERLRSEQLLSEQSSMWSRTILELDDILDIEDDDEREVAFSKWEESQA